MRIFFLGMMLLAPLCLLGQTKFDLTGELRMRAEARQNADFNSELGDQSVFVTQRARAGLQWRFPEQVQAFLQVQDSRLWGEAGSTNRALYNTELHQAYFEIDSIFGKELQLLVGRQEMAFGNERLVGKNSWDQIGRAFDAARLTWGETSQKVDFWLAQNRNKNATGINSYQEFLGAYFSSQKFYHTTAEAYVMALLDDRDFPLGSATGKGLALLVTGARFAGTLKQRWHYEVEGVYQSGQHGDLQVRAFGLALTGSWQIAQPGAPSLRVSYVFGSGDSDPYDKKQETFSALFPSLHEHFGALDYVSWSNVAASTAAFGWKPSRALAIDTQLHYFQLAHGNDAWYSASGFNFDRRNEIFLPAQPGASIEMGYELDLACAYRWRERLVLDFGLSRFFPGGFVRAGNPQADASDWAFLSLCLQL